MKNILKSIKITDIEGVRIGNAQDYEAMTGATVILLGKDNRGGIDISGGGPASREAHLLAPLTNPHAIHAIVLSGGSAYGLAASTGVMEYLRDKGIGYPVAGTLIPLVCQSCIFDMTFGTPGKYPDAAMGYQACIDAENGGGPKSGIAGAGTGAAVGKVRGIYQGQKSGMGYCGFQLGELKVAAVAVVNAFGDVFNPETGEKLAGVMNKERTAFLNAEEELCRRQMETWGESEAQKSVEEVVQPGSNTTLCAVITNASFSQADMSKVASMARPGLGRCISPVGTMADGDTTYAFSMGSVQADINVVGTLAAKAVAGAICDAVISSKDQMSDEEFIKKINI